MSLNNPILIRHIHVNKCLVMPPMQTSITARGHVTAELVQDDRDRAVLSHPGITIREHSRITESGCAADGQRSLFCALFDTPGGRPVCLRNTA